MAAGKSRDPVIFERQDDAGAYDAYGNPAGAAWVEVLACRGWLIETTGREQIAAGRLEATATATLRIRTSADGPAHGLKAGDRVRARRAVWAIIGGPADPFGHGRDLEFTLQRGGAVE